MVFITDRCLKLHDINSIRIPRSQYTTLSFHRITFGGKKRDRSDSDLARPLLRGLTRLIFDTPFRRQTGVRYRDDSPRNARTYALPLRPVCAPVYTRRVHERGKIVGRRRTRRGEQAKETERG